MRPLELRVRNFRSYFGETAFDFRDRTLVGIVGPIGSGKSSVLDAVCLALYGKTPNAGAGTKSLIHQRADDGGALLRFEIEGEVWEVVRSLRRRGQSQHALYRYEDDDPDAEPAERHTLEGEVNDRVAALLGLDFETFGRSVLLAQNRFAEFLRARPAERDAVLKGVFGHDRIDVMRDAAKVRAARVETELAAVAVRAGRLEAVAARLAEVEIERAALEERIECLRKAEPTVTDLEAAIASARADAEAAATQLDMLDSHEERLPDPEGARKLVEDAVVAAERRRALAADVDALRTEVQAAEEALAAARSAGEEDLIEQASRLVVAAASHERTLAECEQRAVTIERTRAEVEKELASVAARVTSYEAAAGEAAQRCDGATATLIAAERALHDAQHREMAATLRTGLSEGAPCPVCEQVVSAVPTRRQPVDVSTAAAAVEDARNGRNAAEEVRAGALAALERARASHEGADSRLAALVAEAEQADVAIADAARELAGIRERLVALLGEGDAAALLAERKRRLAERADAAAEARRRLEQARGRHDTAIADEQATATRLSTLWLDIVQLAGKLDMNVAGATGEIEALGRALDDLIHGWSERADALRTALVDAQERLSAARTELADVLADIDVDPPFADALTRAEVAAAHIAGEVARAAGELSAGEALIAERDRLEAARERYRRLAGDLTDARFVRFLLDDERARLADLGSDHFQRLTSGRYRFTEDGSFAIVDLTTADSVRKASSLSGGETFLASLALALSLAEMVTRTGGRLDAFFLDEGFGSLDPEHLDLAMEGIEALVAEDESRLVVVVSHVPDMRHRIEDLIQLDRDPLTGDTRVVRS